MKLNQCRAEVFLRLLRQAPQMLCLKVLSQLILLNISQITIG
jgi:hypothetical protein